MAKPAFLAFLGPLGLGGDTHTHHNYFRFEVNNHGSDNSKMTVDSVAKLMKQAQRMGKV